MSKDAFYDGGEESAESFAPKTIIASIYNIRDDGIIISYYSTTGVYKWRITIYIYTKCVHVPPLQYKSIFFSCKIPEYTDDAFLWFVFCLGKDFFIFMSTSKTARNYSPQPYLSHDLLSKCYF